MLPIKQKGWRAAHSRAVCRGCSLPQGAGLGRGTRGQLGWAEGHGDSHAGQRDTGTAMSSSGVAGSARERAAGRSPHRSLWFLGQVPWGDGDVSVQAVDRAAGGRLANAHSLSQGSPDYWDMGSASTSSCPSCNLMDPENSPSRDPKPSSPPCLGHTCSSSSGDVLPLCF